MKEVESFKMPFQSGLFNMNQRVWVIYHTGDLAVFCYGRYRGKGCYIRGWVNWDSSNKTSPVFQTFEVENDFYKRMNG